MLKNLLLFAITVTFMTSLAQGTLSNGLLAYYPLNGNTMDESGNGNNGILTSGTLTATYDRFGKTKGANYFDGNTWITTPINAIPSGKLTLSAWIKTSGPNGKDYITVIASRSGFNNANTITIMKNLNLVTNLDAGSGALIQQFVSTPTLVDNIWHFVALTYDGTVMKTYIDGILQKQTMVSISIKVGSHLKIGNDDEAGQTSRNFYGSIDDVRIYDRALSATEILQLNNETACDQTSSERDILVIKTVVTNIDNTSYQNHIRVYPNPVTDNQLTIDYGNYALLNGYKVHVTNSIGVKVFENFVTQAKSEIDLSSWTGSGIYFLSLTDDKGNVLQVRKIILQ